MISDLMGSTILEVVIGLSFVYIVLSLVCSSIQEFFATVFSVRARDLKAGLVKMLSSSKTHELLQHPLIHAMEYSRYAVKDTSGKKLGVPNYIPARTFSLALFDGIVNPKDGEQRSLTVADLRHGLRNRWNESAEVQSSKKALLTLIDSSQSPLVVAREVEDITRWLKNLKDSSSEKEKLLKDLNNLTSLDDARKIVFALPPGSLRSTVLDWLGEGQAALEAARRSVETWFDDSMQRVGDRYKRRVQMWLILIAIVVVLASGADTFRIVRTFQQNDVLRALIVTEATNVASQKDQEGQLQLTQQAKDAIESLWGYPDLPPGLSNRPLHFDSGVLGWLGAKLIGLILTVAAISLGAPFWFDVLRKVSNLRGAGKPPETSGEGKG